MAIKIGFGAVGIKGGEDGNLDNIDSSSFRNRDICIVNYNDKIYIYRVDQYSVEEENYPFLIKPVDIEPDSPLRSRMKRWKLVSQEYFTTHIIQKEDDYTHTSDIKAIENDILSIESGNGSIIIIDEDGTINFPNFVSAEYPQKNHHLSNIKYLQDKMNELELLMESYANNYLTNNQYVINKLNEVDIIIRNYVEQELTDESGYVSNRIDYLDTTIRDYTDTEVPGLSADIDNYYTWLEFTIPPSAESWSPSGDNYYYDVKHNIGDKEFITSFFADNEVIFPIKVEHADIETLRIWMPTNSETIHSNIFFILESGEEYSGPGDSSEDGASESNVFVYSGDYNGELHKIDSDGNNVWVYTGHNNNITSIAVDSNGYVYSGDKGDKVHKIDPDGNNVWVYANHNTPVYAVAVG